MAPGLSRISDGQTLFLLNMLAHAEVPEQGGSRIAIIMNGSPLFTGDAGSGESEIRRYVLEHDLLEALVALPEQLFYNTGIATYVWLLTNRKAPERRGKVQLIDATSFWSPMRRSLGDKRRQIPPDKAADVLQLLSGFEDGATRPVAEDGIEEDVIVSRIFPTTQFGYRKITVDGRCGSTSKRARSASHASTSKGAFRIWPSRRSGTSRSAPGRRPRVAPSSMP